MVMMNDEPRIGDVLAEDGAGAGIVSSQGVAQDIGVPESDAQEDDEREAARGGWSFLQEMVVLLAVALVVALLIKTFVVQPFFIPSQSMQDTLMPGDKVLVNKLVYHLRPVQRGDIIVFNGDGSWLPSQASGPASHNPLARVYDWTLGPLIRSVKDLFGTPIGQTDYIKRVIGLPGDHVACCTAHGQVTVNGVPLHEKSYLIPGAQPSQGRFNVVVPPGRLWVMGDNRPISADSRLHDCAYTYLPPTCVAYDRDGTIPESKVIGRAFVIVWPPSRFRVLPIPATFSRPALSNADGSAASRTGVRSTAGPAVASSRGQVAEALAAGIRVRPSAPYVPLAAGFIAAVPLTFLQRSLRLRLRRRRLPPRG
jgi:signal peptidase I